MRTLIECGNTNVLQLVLVKSGGERFQETDRMSPACTEEGSYQTSLLASRRGLLCRVLLPGHLPVGSMWTSGALPASFVGCAVFSCGSPTSRIASHQLRRAQKAPTTHPILRLIARPYQWGEVWLARSGATLENHTYGLILLSVCVFLRKSPAKFAIYLYKNTQTFRPFLPWFLVSLLLDQKREMIGLSTAHAAFYAGRGTRCAVSARTLACR